MDKILIRRYLPAIVMLIGFALVWSARSQRAVPLAASLDSVLPEYENFRVTRQTVSTEEARIAGFTDYVARAFWRPDSTVAFTSYVGYYDRQSQGHTMHSPKNCLPGAGWEILRADTGLVSANGKQYVVNKNLLKKEHYQALVLYWYQGRGRVAWSEYAVKWNLLRDAALEGHTEEALVRVIVYLPRSTAIDGSKYRKALAEADSLGSAVGARLLNDVSHVLPGGPLTSGSAAVAPVPVARTRAL
jgi:EpsI family protein